MFFARDVFFGLGAGLVSPGTFGSGRVSVVCQSRRQRFACAGLYVKDVPFRQFSWRGPILSPRRFGFTASTSKSRMFPELACVEPRDGIFPN